MDDWMCNGAGGYTGLRNGAHKHCKGKDAVSVDCMRAAPARMLRSVLLLITELNGALQHTAVLDRHITAQS